jgi:octopine/nopaline transport system permease protein
MNVMGWTLLSWGDEGWGDELFLGALITVTVAICAYVVGICLGIVLAACKLSNSRVLGLIATGYTTVVRGVPELLVVYLVFFGSSGAIMAIAKGLFGYGGYIEIPLFATGVLCISLSSAAYATEAIRGGVLAIPYGQIDAAKAVGMSGLLRFRRILVPQATRYALPSLANVWLFTLKDTSLLSVIGLSEVMRQAYVAAGSTQQPFTFYISAFLIYLILALGSNRAFMSAEAHADRGVRRA